MPTRPRLLIISISRIVSDPRVLKQVRLFSADYEVTTCGQGPAPDGVVAHLEIPSDARGWVDDRVALITRQYTRAYENIQGVAAARHLLAGSRFDIVLANDLVTLPLALSLEPRLGVHADLHEFAPREKEDLLGWRLFVAPFLRWICRRYLPRVASATTVAPGIARAYEKDYGVPFGVVTNAAPYADREPQPVHSPIRMIHSAAGQRQRRLENFIELMRDAPPGVELDLIVMPNEPDYVAELKAAGATIPRLRFIDPVPYAQLVELVAGYDVSLNFLPPLSFNHRHALPNKFFEAVQARIGLVIGPSPEMVSILEQYGLGAVARDFEVDSLRDAIASMTPELVAQWKEAAHRAARALSAEEQNRGWAEPIAAIAARRAEAAG
ncbi:MAG: glycosyltransferase [Microbacterium sp.]|nr:glycosyltransferase [Microbacterium sp.]MBA4346867.1 glycosyltransferase [Microbacterium sp.]